MKRRIYMRAVVSTHAECRQIAHFPFFHRTKHISFRCRIAGIYLTAKNFLGNIIIFIVSLLQIGTSYFLFQILFHFNSILSLQIQQQNIFLILSFPNKKRRPQIMRPAFLYSESFLYFQYPLISYLLIFIFLFAAHWFLERKVSFF